MSYGHGYVEADRRPENQMAAVIGPDGLVARLVLAPTDEPTFLGVMRNARKSSRLAPDELDMHGVPVDADGRGLTILEMQQRQHTPNEVKAA